MRAAGELWKRWALLWSSPSVPAGFLFSRVVSSYVCRLSDRELVDSVRRRLFGLCDRAAAALGSQPGPQRGAYHDSKNRLSIYFRDPPPI